jgi:hypothetical protein
MANVFVNNRFQSLCTNRIFGLQIDPVFGEIINLWARAYIYFQVEVGRQRIRVAGNMLSTTFCFRTSNILHLSGFL